MKHTFFLEKLFNGEDLTELEAEKLMVFFLRNDNEVLSSALLSGISTKGINEKELNGFIRVLKDKCIKIGLKFERAMDVCGTGGDHKNTFNISTLTAFVVAASGYKVCKHGNFASSSSSGSSDIVSYFGYDLQETKTDILQRQLDETGLCYFHAPTFHPALKAVGKLRKTIGVRTVFNIFGPLANPASITHQMIGCFNHKIAQLYHKYLYMNHVPHIVFSSDDGFDEITLTDQVNIIADNSKDKLFFSDFSSKIKPVNPQNLRGGRSKKEAANFFVKTLQGETTQDALYVVAANAATAVKVMEPKKSLSDCFAQCLETLNSGRAFATFKKFFK